MGKMYNSSDAFNAEFGSGYDFKTPGAHVVKISDHMSSLDFSGNPNIEEVTFGSEISEIEPGSFAECGSLTRFDASRSKIRSLGKDTLRSCSSLKTISLPKTYDSDDILTYSLDQATKGTENTLESIEVDNVNPKYGSVSGLLIRKADGFLIRATRSIPYDSSTGNLSLGGSTISENMAGIATNAFYNIILPSNNSSGTAKLDLSEMTSLLDGTTESPSIMRHAFYGSNIDSVVFPSGLTPDQIQDNALEGVKSSVTFRIKKRMLVESQNYNTMGLDTSKKITAFNESGGLTTFWWSYAYTIPGCYPCLVGDYAYMRESSGGGTYAADGEYIIEKNIDDGYFSYPEDYNVGTTRLEVKSGKLVSATPITSGIFISWKESRAMFIRVGMDVGDERFNRFCEFFDIDTGDGQRILEFSADSNVVYMVGSWNDGYEIRLWDSTSPDYYTGDVRIFLTIRDGKISYVSIDHPEGLWYNLDPEQIQLVSVSLEYKNSPRHLPGMTKDSDRISSFVGPVSVEYVFKNEEARVPDVKNAIKAALSDTSCNLLIFHFSGHGGETEKGSNRTTQFMSLYGQDWYDFDFWQTIKDGVKERCTSCTTGDVNVRVFCIFACCNSATMFIGRSTDKSTQNESQGGKYVFSASAKPTGDVVDFGRGLAKVVAEDEHITFGTSEDGRVTMFAEDNVPIDFGLLSWGACAANTVSYMTYGKGHDMITAMEDRLADTPGLDSYQQLWEAVVNSKNKKPALGDNPYVKPYKHWIGQEDFSNLKRFR